MTDIILIAPIIKIDDEVTGNFQAFATNQIITGKKISLNYPTILAVIRPRGAGWATTFIELGEQCKVDGLLIGINLSGTSEPNVIPVSVSTEKNTLIRGQIFVEGSVNLHGKVYGNITCKSFRLITDGASYDNYLFNAEINEELRSKYYLSPLIFKSKEPENRNICKWLN